MVHQHEEVYDTKDTYSSLKIELTPRRIEVSESSFDEYGDDCLEPFTDAFPRGKQSFSDAAPRGTESFCAIGSAGGRSNRSLRRGSTAILVNLRLALALGGLLIVLWLRVLHRSAEMFLTL